MNRSLMLIASLAVFLGVNVCEAGANFRIANGTEYAIRVKKRATPTTDWTVYNNTGRDGFTGIIGHGGNRDINNSISDDVEIVCEIDIAGDQSYSKTTSIKTIRSLNNKTWVITYGVIETINNGVNN